MKTMNDLEKANAFYGEAQDRMMLIPNYYLWIYSAFSDYIKGNVLEVGAGAGHFMPCYLKHVDHVYALDHNPMLTHHIEERFDSVKVSSVTADLCGDIGALIHGEMDVVIALDVFEHFDDDGALVARTAELLATGGFLLLKVPAQSDLFGHTDRASGHFRRYDPEILRKVMRKAGLEEVSLKFFNRLGAFVYRLRRNRDTNFSKTFNPLVLRVINLTIPIVAAIDRIMPGKGLSLIGIYRKP